MKDNLRNPGKQIENYELTGCQKGQKPYQNISQKIQNGEVVHHTKSVEE
jgi:hypothetical protein